MTETRTHLREFLLGWLEQNMPGNIFVWYDILVILWIASFAIALHYMIRGLAKHFLKGKFEVIDNQQTKNVIFALFQRLAKRLSLTLQGAIVVIQAKLWLAKEAIFLHLAEVITNQWIILFSLLSLFTFLDILQSFSDKRTRQAHFPLRGLLQTVKLIASIFTAILAVSLLMDKSPLILLSGLGALSAVLLLVFKDPILGLVAGIQLSANNMLAVGDWLEMPKYGADGDVVDIALTTVKVRNWDKTITTIPTYALISDSFKNWRGMSEAGGRRIKRSIHLEIGSICFLDKAQLNELKKAHLLSEYITHAVPEIEKENIDKKTDMTVMQNGRRLTNVGTFRKYLLSFLQNHPDIHQGMTLIVRQLEPTSNGLPVEIYAFTNTTNWNAYEDIQSDIFDHVIAVLPAFSLRVHESPTGNDIRSLAKH
ncbi:mechanosensitive ion channel family protein [Colwellia sp. C1TZA3]|uniref:mechanosensitive ion channel family protein n=1 Tax=Colwellia sp. C1TZA3 TaxID=2508879 RepID=UPI0011B9F4F7|nr:mechanosensitive ion channel domain-containing protein [Colwellia sp. C1TZA3]TWX71148.1 mechanosensitive ion channel [Colwellia sp. C1TZA3]